ncbi:MAG: class I SAM-dependent methyltransferase [Gammaproteobacteria bacterium]|nr:class I SAM-dependent methyltransferase [Gammaproteobacteria bacterium]
MKTIVPRAIEDYAVNHSTAPTPLLVELEQYTRAHCADPQMLIGRLEGGLLRMLVKLTGARRILEIGLYTGYSTLTMAEALPQDGELITCDRDPETSRIAQAFFDRSPHGRKITIRLGRALDTLRSLPPNPAFDLVFIDADKKNYSAYYDLVLPRMKTGGLLVADNALWSGSVLAPKQESDHALIAFNKAVQDDPRIENVLLTVRDGVMLARKTAE